MSEILSETSGKYSIEFRQITDLSKCGEIYINTWLSGWHTFV